DLLLLLLLFPLISTFKILIYNSKFAHSHSKFMGAVADTLMDAGHEVISLMPIIDPSVPDYTKTKIIRYERDDAVTNHLMQFHAIDFFTIPVDEWTLPWTMGPPTAGMFAAMCNRMINEPGLIEKLKAEKFDVAINEGDPCGEGFFHLIGVPAYISSSSLSALPPNLARSIGIPMPTSYIPGFNTVHLDKHSMWSRIMNWINNKAIE
ncbi:hypothetical protein PFISCL1PPCAC_6431, partial [Pristionchus fissidentatus]